MKRNKLKKLIAISMVVTISLTALVGCRNKDEGGSNNITTNGSVEGEGEILDSVISVETALKNAKLEGERDSVEGTVRQYTLLQEQLLMGIHL